MQLLTVLLYLGISATALALGTYRDNIPNGYFVPCVSGECLGYCAGVGHINSDGTMGCLGGEHPTHANNQFGLDIERFGNYFWNRQVCLQDSDGDLKSNGDELGDPCCIWNPAAPTTPTRGKGQLSHPGSSKSKVSARSCVFDGAPSLSYSNVTTSWSSMSVKLSSGSDCVCGHAITLAAEGSDPVFVNIFDYAGGVITVSGLDAGTNYTVTIGAVNFGGNGTQTFDFQTPPLSPNAPAPPASISLVFASTNAIAVSWTSASNVDSYELDIKTSTDGAFYTVYSGADLSYQAKNLTGGTTYDFRVRSVSDINGPSNHSQIFSFSTSAGSSTGPVATTGHIHPSPPPTGDPTGGYQLVITPHHTPRAGIVSAFNLQIRDPSGNPILWSEFAEAHGRKMHIVFVGSDYDIFGHIHPESWLNGTTPLTDFYIEFTFPKSGRYMASCDFGFIISDKRSVKRHTFIQSYTAVNFVDVLESLDTPVLPSLGNPDWNVSAVISMKGYPWDARDTYVHAVSMNDSVINSGTPGFKVALSTNKGGPVYSGKTACTSLDFTVMNNADSSPITDMMQYLTMGMHVVAIHENFNMSTHIHGSPIASFTEEINCYGTEPTLNNTDRFGPYLRAYVLLPVAGKYRLFTQSNFNNSQLFMSTFVIEAVPDPNEFAPLTADDVQEGDYDHQLMVLDGMMTIYWKIEGENVINIAMVGNTLGWLGIGFEPSDGGMKDCDMYLGWVSGGSVTVQDTWSTGEVSPTQDLFMIGDDGLSGWASVNEKNGNQNEATGTTTIKFRRDLDTSDPFDAPISDRKMSLVFAYNANSDTLVTHGVVNRGSAKINFFNGEIDLIISSTEQMQQAHAILMALGWMFFVTLGILSARFGHAYNWWFPFHIVVMLIGMISMLGGFIIGVVMSTDDFVQTNKLILAHSWIGLFVVIGGLIQPFLGILADRLYDPMRTSVPIWPDKIHWLVGRYAYVGAVLNVFLGMIYLEVQVVWYVIFFVWIALVICIYHVLDLRTKKVQEQHQKGAVNVAT
eukprot:TRINITY_DN2368_c0_g1_i2.p1 TRINITY_DN2368_c0_g1~~TRINITY_DN2368_c0_g1_i2.p1  ORF type:complete len:1022 (-),score=215.75 TRINITY_DN2368_c0_g1_i2:37-3102(-)